MKTIENNKLVAEFMGLAYCEKYRFEGWYKNSEFNNRICGFEGLKYHSSWDWLMLVVEKIETLGFEVRIEGISCKINKVLDRDNLIVSWVCGDKSNKIGLVYTAVIKFIEWHNTKK